jgi:hypothetical protein
MKRWSPLLLIVLLPAISPAADSPVAPTHSPNPGTALITGSDRGIGFALLQEFESRGTLGRKSARKVSANEFSNAQNVKSRRDAAGSHELGSAFSWRCP